MAFWHCVHHVLDGDVFYPLLHEDESSTASVNQFQMQGLVESRPIGMAKVMPSRSGSLDQSTGFLVALERHAYRPGILVYV